MPGIELRSQCQFEQHAIGLLLAQREGQRRCVVHVLQVQLLLQVTLCRQAADDEATAKGEGQQQYNGQPELFEE